MRDRLIELIKQVPYGATVGAKFTQYFSEKMADHLLANGVIVPPCKVGDRLYQIVKTTRHTFVSEFPIIVEPQQIIYRNIMGFYFCIPFDDFGKTAFLTREEAEKALRERSGE